MALSIQERLKDLRVERRLTLEQLAEQTELSKSVLGSNESDDYLLARTETKSHPNASLADLCPSEI